MSIYLIDYENTKNLSGVKNLSDSDKVIIFYSKNADSLSFETHLELNNAKAEIIYKKADVGGKNALDFQLCTYLGFLIREYIAENENFYIVSKDKIFSYLLEFWKKEMSIEIELIPSLSADNADSPEKIKQSGEEDLINKLKRKLPKSDDSEISAICDIINESADISILNIRLTKLLKDGKKVHDIISVIKQHK